MIITSYYFGNRLNTVCSEVQWLLHKLVMDLCDIITPLSILLHITSYVIFYKLLDHSKVKYLNFIGYLLPIDPERNHYVLVTLAMPLE